MCKSTLISMLLLMALPLPAVAVDTLDVRATVKTTVAGEWTTFSGQEVPSGIPYQTRDGILWWGAKDGAIRYDGNVWAKCTSRDGLMDGAVRTIVQAEDGTLWFAGSHQGKAAVTRYDGKIWQIYSAEEELIDDWIAGPGAIDNQENLWLGTRFTDLASAYEDRTKGGNGVLRFDGKTWRNYRVEDGLAHNRVYDLCADPDGSVWMATFGGVSRFDGENWTTYTQKDGLSWDKTVAILVAQDGKIWCTHEWRGISTFDGISWEHITKEKGMPVQGVRGICETEDGAIWFGTEKDDRASGLLRYKDGTWLRIVRKDGLPGDNVRHITQARDSGLWLMVPEVGVVRYQPDLTNLGIVSGKLVYRTDGTPCRRALVRVEGTEGRSRATTRTHTDGQYRVAVFPGDYLISVAYAEGVVPIAVSAGAQEQIRDINFAPAMISPPVEITLPGRWRYHAGDNMAWASPEFDDSSWETAYPQLLHDLLPRDGWKGIGWFRAHLNVDSTDWNQPIALNMIWHAGASEIYLDGRLLYTFGKVGSSRADEEPYWERNPKVISFGRNAEHLIAVRYSNFSADRFYEVGGPAGFYIELADLDRSIKGRVDDFGTMKNWLTILAGPPLTLAVLHCLLFVFYRRSRENLYYAVFAACLGALVFLFVQNETTTDPGLYMFLFKTFKVGAILCLVAAIRFAYSLFYARLPRQFWGLLIAGMGLSLWDWFYPLQQSFDMPIWLIVISLIAFAEMFRVVLVAVLRRKDGAWIIGSGFTAFILSGLFAPVVTSVPLPFLGGLCIVASMSVYLARNIAKTNREKEFVTDAFGHYLSPAVVDTIIDQPDMINQLGGEERVMTAFFSDIASFSTISECLTPSELVLFINDYLTEMCDIIEDYGGTIDKFEGDAIVAFFGAPIYYEDHAGRACLCCIDQQKKLVEVRERWKTDSALPQNLQQLRERWEAQNRTFMQVRMGIAAGPMVVGNMGSKTRNDYTMMGDTVNLASRLESIQKVYGTNIMINDMIYDQVKDIVETRKLDLIQVLGKEEPVAAYEVLDRKGQLSQEKYQVLELYSQGLEAYEDYAFTEAQEFFKQALEIDPHDGPSALNVERCEQYAINAPIDLIFRAQIK